MIDSATVQPWRGITQNVCLSKTCAFGYVFGFSSFNGEFPTNIRKKSNKYEYQIHSVDGWNPAQVDWSRIPLSFTKFEPSQLVQAFNHPTDSQAAGKEPWTPQIRCPVQWWSVAGELLGCRLAKAPRHIPKISQVLFPILLVSFPGW